jgi:hypothetical protein
MLSTSVYDRGAVFYQTTDVDKMVFNGILLIPAQSSCFISENSIP